MKSITILKRDFCKVGGAEKYARLLANAFHESGCEVRVLTTGPIVENFPFEVVSFSSKSITSVSKLWDFEGFCETYLRDHPTDIIFGQDRNRFQTHLRAGSGVHKAFLRHRSAFEPKWKTLRHLLNPLHTSLLHFEKMGFEHPDLRTLFVNSHLVKEEILSHYVVDPGKIEVIHNGVEWHSFTDDFANRTPSSDRHEFLFVGSGFARKGLSPLLQGLRLLSNDTYHLTVVGGDTHMRFYEKMAKGLSVSFVGAQRDIRPFLQASDILVIPSHYDPFANVTVEALAMGLFVVSSKTNGGAEVLTEASGCVIEDLTSPDSVKTALETALKTKRDPLSIRNSVEHLDFSTQLTPYVTRCLATS